MLPILSDAQRTVQRRSTKDDPDRATVKVGVSIFGRATPVELDFEQVELAK